MNDTSLKPARHAEHHILSAILSGSWPEGTALPAERILADQIGVTRPTLREALHRLAREGWLTICHGKPTLVNDFWKTGGLSLLSTLADYAQYVPTGFVHELLHLRVVLMPDVAEQAAKRHPQALAEAVARAADVPDTAEAFVEYDWQLQKTMGDLSENRLFRLMQNDFAGLFSQMAAFYFADPAGRAASRQFYADLARALETGPEAVAEVVRQAMVESRDLFVTVTS